MTEPRTDTSVFFHFEFCDFMGCMEKVENGSGVGVCIYKTRSGNGSFGIVASCLLFIFLFQDLFGPSFYYILFALLW